MDRVVSAPLPPLPPVLEEALWQSVAVSDALYAILPTTCGSSLASHVGAAYLSMALDHREASILLIRHGAFASAYALARPTYEKSCRGLWARVAATDAQLTALLDGIVPSFETVGKQLAKDCTVGALAAIRSSAWSALSDHTHGGAVHLRGWMTADQIGHQIAPEELPSLLLLLDIYGYFAAFGLLACADLDSEPANRVYEQNIAARVAAIAENRRGEAAPGAGAR